LAGKVCKLLEKKTGEDDWGKKTKAGQAGKAGQPE
jgi:hypothetical protein